MNKTLKIENKLQGQILVLTLLALFVISIIAVALFNIASRDIEQTVQNREYTRLLGVSENRVIEIASVFASETVPLSQVASSDPGCSQVTTTQYSCTNTNGTVTTLTVLQEQNTVQNFPLDKDQYLEVAMNNYRGTIDFSYSTPTALEFSLLVRNTTTGAYKVYNDLFDLSSVFTNNGGNPLSDPLNNHYFTFSTITGGYRFTTASIPANENILRLKITARKHTPGAVGLNLNGTASFPNFVRRFTATTYDSATATAITATTTAIVPLSPQSFGIFDYALLVDGPVTKSAASF